MEKRKLAYVTLLITMFASILTPHAAVAGVDDIVVVEVIQENVLNRGRTSYYTYSLQITNNGNALTNVTARVSSQTRTIRVTERNLRFGDLGAGALLGSVDTFTIRVGSRVVPDLSALIYTFNGDEAAVEDTVAPTISAQLSAQANSNGWHNAPVVVSFQCTDNVAIASCTGDVTVASDGENQVIVGTATDTSGNAATTQVIINLDTQAPLVNGALFAGSDTPPVDSATLLQRASLDVTSDPNIPIKIYQGGDQSVLLGELQTNASGDARLNNVDLALGQNAVLLRATDLAGNVGEAEISIARLQCLAQASSQGFYVDNLPLNGSDASLISPDQSSFIGRYEQFSANAQNLVKIVPAFIDNDVLTDWVVIEQNQFGVLIALNGGDGTYSDATFKQTGGSVVTAAVLANLVDSLAIDLAVGHSDGSVSIFAGDGNGGFSDNPVASFNQTNSIAAMQAADLDQDGDIDLLVASETQLNVYLREDDTEAQALITNGNFNNGLAGWQVEVIGHKATEQAGQVVNAGSGAQLFENASFLTSLSQSFTPPDDATILSFNLFSVFLEHSNGAIPDALEVSLLDASKQSMVDTFRPEATSFLNIRADGTVNTAQGVTYSGGNVQVDISAVNTPVTLYFDLIGNPPGTSSSFIVSNVDAGETMMVNNDYLSSLIDNSLVNADGAVFCDAVASNPPILLSDPTNQQIKMYQKDSSGNFVITTTLAQGGE